MRYQAFVRAAATVLSTAFVAAGAVYAQARPEPATMTDVAPLPATERQSSGAVILMDEPVLAQREALQQAQERSGIDTRSMGAGPTRLMRNAQREEALRWQKAIEEAEKEQQRKDTLK